MKKFFKKLFNCKCNSCENETKDVTAITWDLKIDENGNVVELSADRELVGKMYDTILEVYGKGDTFKSRSKKIWEACEEIVLTVEPYLGDMETLPFKVNDETNESETSKQDE